MKRTTTTIISLLFSLVFIIAIVYFGYNISTEIKHGNERTRKTFNHFVNKVEKNINVEKQDYQSYIDNPEDFLAISIKENNKTVLKTPENVNDDFSNISNTYFVKIYTKKVVHNDKILDINLALYKLRPSQIYHYALYTFIIVLIATIFIISIICYITISENKTKKINYEESEKNVEEIEQKDDYFTSEESSIETEDTTENELTLENDESFEQLEWPEHTAIINDIKTNNENVSDEVIDEDSTESTQIQEDKETEELEQYEKKDDYTANPVPYTILTTELSEINKNTYSEITGISKQTSFVSKLDTELVHATSSEQDLSLFIIKIPGLMYSDEETKIIINTLLEQFLYRDTIFEFENDGFAVIKSDMTIDEAEQKADYIYKQLKEKINDISTYIGISSRSTRMLGAERLIKEAKEALNHAIETKDETPIVGFHVDVEKYRDFIKNS